MLHLPALLTPAQVQGLNAIAAAGRFVDGRATAQGMVADTKNNEQLERNEATGREISDIVRGALQACQPFQAWAFPKTIVPPMINRHGMGMYYDRHLDSPVMQGVGGAVRTDISFTIFLSPPDSYEGGELCIETDNGECAVKLPAGDAFAYNTTVLHRVARVTSGVRLACVGWVQSYVRDPARRAILHGMSEAHRQIIQAAPDSEAAELLGHASGNLLRMWMEP